MLPTELPTGERPVKTTLDIDEKLLAEAKKAATRERKSLATLIEEGLRLRLRRRPATKRRHVAKLPVFKGRGGLAAGIDPTSNRSLFAAAGDDP